MIPTPPPGGRADAAPAPLARPTREDIAGLPEFDGLPLARIHLVDSEAIAQRAMRALADAVHIGFDTESKPTFVRGQASGGPHLVQLATMDEAFIVQVDRPTPAGFLRWAIESDDLVRVGFGLRSDRAPLIAKTGLALGPSVDLARRLRERGYTHDVGLKTAVAIVLGRRLRKPRSATTSNWALPALRPAQLLYAANDAHAALAVFRALDSAQTRAPA